MNLILTYQFGAGSSGTAPLDVKEALRRYDELITIGAKSIVISDGIKTISYAQLKALAEFQRRRPTGTVPAPK